MNQDNIRLVFGTDANYAPHLGVLLKSIAKSNRHEMIHIHILHDGVDKLLQGRVESCAPDLFYEWIEINNHRVLDFEGLLQITRATYLRLTMLEALSPGIKRVLYLDIDTVVNGPLRPLWETDLGTNICAAVIDPGVDVREFAAKWDLPLPGKYFNAGVILFDLDKLRQEPFLERAIEILDNKAKPCEYADQDALNIVLWNKWFELSWVWNFQRKFMYADFIGTKKSDPIIKKPIITHYTERQKPWQQSEWHPHAWLYTRNLMRTPFQKEVFSSEGLGFRHCLKLYLRWLIKGPKIA